MLLSKEHKLMDLVLFYFLVTRMRCKYYILKIVMPMDLYLLTIQLLHYIPKQTYRNITEKLLEGIIYMPGTNKRPIFSRMYYFCNLFFYSRFFEILNKSQILTPSQRNLVYIVVVPLGVSSVLIVV